MQVTLHQSRDNPDDYIVDDEKKLDGHRSILFMEPSELRGIYKALKAYIAQIPIPVPPNLNEETDAALAGAYIILRDRKASKNREAKVVDKNLTDAMDRITSIFLVRFKERGSTSIGVSGVGTVTRGKSIKVASTDWKTHYTYQLGRAKEIEAAGGDPTEIFSALHKRLSIEPIEAYMDLHDGQTPPGIEVKTEYGINVRKSNSKGDENYE